VGIRRLGAVVAAALQDRLERQQQSNDEERARLEGFIAQLESRLTEQASSLEQVLSSDFFVVDVPH